MNQQFKTVPINCTGLVRFAVSHIRVKNIEVDTFLPTLEDRQN